MLPPKQGSYHNKRNLITPYELWNKKKLNLSYFKVWGCRAIVKVPEPKKRKLGERGIECVFIGYAERSKAYRFLVIEPNASIGVNTVVESIDAIFDETRFSSIPKPNDLIPTTMTASNDQEQGDIVEVRRSKRIRMEKSFVTPPTLWLGVLAFFFKSCDETDRVSPES